MSNKKKKIFDGLQFINLPQEKKRNIMPSNLFEKRIRVHEDQIVPWLPVDQKKIIIIVIKLGLHKYIYTKCC